jgi:hypothetical protein
LFSFFDFFSLVQRLVILTRQNYCFFFQSHVMKSKKILNNLIMRKIIFLINVNDGQNAGYREVGKGLARPEPTPSGRGMVGRQWRKSARQGWERARNAHGFAAAVGAKERPAEATLGPNAAKTGKWSKVDSPQAPR